MYIPLGERELAKEIEQRGKERGIAEGKAEGKEEGKEEMVRNLLAKGFSPEIIAESASWPLERVQHLLN